MCLVVYYPFFPQVKMSVDSSSIPDCPKVTTTSSIPQFRLGRRNFARNGNGSRKQNPSTSIFTRQSRAITNARSASASASASTPSSSSTTETPFELEKSHTFESSGLISFSGRNLAISTIPEDEEITEEEEEETCDYKHESVPDNMPSAERGKMRAQLKNLVAGNAVSFGTGEDYLLALDAVLYSLQTYPVVFDESLHRCDVRHLSDDVVASLVTYPMLSGTVLPPEVDTTDKYLDQLKQHLTSTPEGREWWLERDFSTVTRSHQFTIQHLRQPACTSITLGQMLHMGMDWRTMMQCNLTMDDILSSRDFMDDPPFTFTQLIQYDLNFEFIDMKGLLLREQDRLAYLSQTECPLEETMFELPYRLHAGIRQETIHGITKSLLVICPVNVLPDGYPVNRHIVWDEISIEYRAYYKFFVLFLCMLYGNQTNFDGSNTLTGSGGSNGKSSTNPARTAQIMSILKVTPDKMREMGMEVAGLQLLGLTRLDWTKTLQVPESDPLIQELDDMEKKLQEEKATRDRERELKRQKRKRTAHRRASRSGSSSRSVDVKLRPKTKPKKKSRHPRSYDDTANTITTDEWNQDDNTTEASFSVASVDDTVSPGNDPTASSSVWGLLMSFVGGNGSTERREPPFGGTIQESAQGEVDDEDEDTSWQQTLLDTPVDLYRSDEPGTVVPTSSENRFTGSVVPPISARERPPLPPTSQFDNSETADARALDTVLRSGMRLSSIAKTSRASAGAGAGVGVGAASGGGGARPLPGVSRNRLFRNAKRRPQF